MEVVKSKNYKCCPRLPESTKPPSTTTKHQATGDRRRTLIRSPTSDCDNDEGILEEDMIETEIQATDESASEESLALESREYSSSVSDVEGSLGEESRVNESEDYESYHTSRINGIVLEYLEVLGLEESCQVLSNECTKKGIPLPLGTRDPIFPHTKFTQKDINAFFKHFDNWEGEELNSVWCKFSDEVEDKGSNIFRQSFILLRIYIASLPFRKNEDSAYKLNALDELREFHQAYSEEFIKDPMCIALFAFPFVSDPDIHSAFTEVFTKKWQLNLRKQLESFFKAHLETVNDVSTCDLKQMYHHYIEEVNRFGSNIQDDQLPDSPLEVENPGDSISGVHKDTAAPAKDDGSTQGKEFDRPTTATFNADICAYMKKTLIQSQDRYCKLLRVTSAVVIALEQAVQGKAQNIHILQSQLQESFPELFNPMCSSPTPMNKNEIVYKKSENSVNLRPRAPVKVERIDKPKLQTSQQEVCLPLLDRSSKLLDEEDDAEASAGDVETDETSKESDASEESESETNSESRSSSCVEFEPEACECSLHSTTTASQLSSSPALKPRQHPVGSPGFSIFSSGRKMKEPRNLVVPKQQQRKVNVRSRQKNTGLSQGVVKHRNSKMNAKINLNSDKFVASEGQEIPEEFCQYFPGLSPQHGVAIGKEIKNSLLPPSFLDPFPSPPRTYEVSPRNSKLIYIPSSLEVGCTSRNPTAVSQGHPVMKFPSTSALGDRELRGKLAKESSFVKSLGIKKQEHESLKSKRRPGANFEVNKEQKVNQHQQEHTENNSFKCKNVTTRILTPRVETKSTTMASILGVLKMEAPPSKRSTERQGHQRKSPTQLRWFRNADGDTSKLSVPPPSTVSNPRSTKTQPVNSIESKTFVRKKYSSDDQGCDIGQSSRISKLANKSRARIKF